MPPLFQLVLIVMAFVGSMLALTLVYWAWANRREIQRQRMVHRLGLDHHAAEAVRIERKNEQQPWRWLRDLQEAAGERGDVRNLMLRIVGLSIGGLLVTMWILPGLAKILGLLLGAVPILLLLRAAAIRDEKLTEQLPDALDRIARSLRAGQAFSDAFRIAAQDMPSPVADEFARVAEGHRLGIELRTCMNDLAKRHHENFDIQLFVSAVLLHRGTGGNLIEMLEHLSETVRERLIFHKRARALTAETRTSALILGFLPFFVAGVLMVVQPTYLLPLITTSLGRGILGAALLSLFFGTASMRWIAQVEV